MNAPRGLGFWVAFEGAITPKGKAEDLRQAIEWCKLTGVTWVALRAGHGAQADRDLSPESIKAFLDAGIDPYVWIFAYQRTAQAEQAGYAHWFSVGAKGAIINAEFEYATATADDARRLVEGIRVAWDANGTGGDSFVAHAPPDYLGAGLGHPLRSQLVALDDACDLIMPQVYAWEHDDKGHAYHLDRIAQAYDRRGYTEKLAPIGCTYRPKMRGGKPTPYLEDEPTRVAADVIAFLDHASVKACPCPSLYTLDAIGWINGRTDQVISVMSERYSKGADATEAPAPAPAASLEEGLSIFDGAATPLRAPEAVHTPKLRSED